MSNDLERLRKLAGLAETNQKTTSDTHKLYENSDKSDPKPKLKKVGDTVEYTKGGKKFKRKVVKVDRKHGQVRYELNNGGFVYHDDLDDDDLYENANEKERPYVCVHVKKGEYECKANSSYEAAKKAAKHWGLKSTSGIDAHLADKDHVATESQQMREWVNSIYQRYEDRGHIDQEQPSGNVDTSLRRYLGADGMPVKLEESHSSEDLFTQYLKFKKAATKRKK